MITSLIPLNSNPTSYNSPAVVMKEMRFNSLLIKIISLNIDILATKKQVNVNGVLPIISFTGDESFWSAVQFPFKGLPCVPGGQEQS